LDALLISIGLVSLAEIGDKTMLLAIALAATWRRPVPIVLGILAATLVNHAFAALAGTLAAQYLDGPWMRWVIGLAFLGFAVWALIPDALEVEDAEVVEKTAWGVFWTTTAAFFLVEMGDKTQIATAGLAIRFGTLPMVVAGSTIGMMLVNAPAVWLGEATAARLPLTWIRMAAAAAFAVTGLWVLVWG
jgi:putative Ca2+/H+ antiporter (TMEM165/GDT1 family)